MRPGTKVERTRAAEESILATVEAGNMAPDLRIILPDADGTPYNLADALTSGPLLIGIYKSSCAASKAMMPMLERLYERYRSDGLQVFGVAQDSPNITRSFARRTGATYPVLIEADGYPVSVAFDIFATPTVYLIGTNGQIAYTTMGFMRDQINELAEAVANLLGLPPEIIVAIHEDDIPRFVPG
jgi:peroxiredoxin